MVFTQHLIVIAQITEQYVFNVFCLVICSGGKTGESFIYHTQRVFLS